MHMASSSNFYSPAATSPPSTKYDVFISFNGKDTRNGFTSHLHSALRKNQIETFIDYRIEKGGEIWEELVEAIRESMVSLVIFSEHYAQSKWCLRELVEIMECKSKKEDYHIIPVFYKIEPNHVRKQRGSYYSIFADHERNLDHGIVSKWRKVLFDAANISGFECNGRRTEAEIIEGIVQMVVQKMKHKYTNQLRSPFIRDQNYACIETLLKTQSREVQTIGIWGMGGIGKTTIAAAIFKEFSPKYEGSCFLENVREESSSHGPDHIFKKFLSELLEEKVHISTHKVISSAIIRRLSRKKVFIVLDDVHTSELLETLLGVGDDYLGFGSKVIVTTRDKHVLQGRVIVDHIHEVREMNFENSVKLFSLNAFNKLHPPEDEYWDLSMMAVAYASGIPLALKVLGSFLRSKTYNEWESALAKLKAIPNGDIQQVLRWSFNELDHAEKDIFLDIACFFKGQNRCKITRLLNACGFYAEIGIRTLLDKALIRITINDSIQMHDLIQEMGHKIVNEESIKNPGGPSRLWKSEEVRDILKNDKGTDAIETIFLDMTQDTDLCISSQPFRKMPNLRLLAFADNKAFQRKKKRTNETLALPTDLELPNNLRYIQWDGCPLKSLTTSCWPTKLVELSMPFSDVEKLWDGEQSLPSLEIINLEYSRRMRECPNLSGAPNLKLVKLTGCESLTDVHPSVFRLPKIESLFVYECKALTSLSSEYCPPSLQTIVAYNCPNLQEFSVPMVGDHSGIHLHLRSTALKKLPSSIFHLKDLGHFSFSISESLMDLPSNFAYQIMLSDPVEHKYDTAITLHKVLPSPAFQSVVRLIFDHCCCLTEIPDSISLLSSLAHLNLYCCTNVITLSESIKLLPRLRVLNIFRCGMLELLPILPPSLKRLRVWDCNLLKTVLTIISEPHQKDEGTFLFLNCNNLDEDSYSVILRDAILRTERGVKSPSSETEFESQEEEIFEVDHDCFADFTEICYLLPVRGSNIRDLFDVHSVEVYSLSVEFPQYSNLAGFLFFIVLSEEQWRHIEEQAWYENDVTDLLSFGCDCYLETSWGEKVHTKSFSLLQWSWDQLYHHFNINSDHALLWYDEKCCKKIMEPIRGRKGKDIKDEKKSTCNANLTLEFFAGVLNKVDVVIQECGIRWIYQSVEEEEGSRGRKSKRTKEEAD